MMTRRTREWTLRVLEGMNEGLLDPTAIAEMCLAYMSEDDVEDMCRINDLKYYLVEDEEEETEEDPMDDFNHPGNKNHY